MTTFTETNRNIATHTNESKNVSSFSMLLRHGKEPTLAELANFKFTDVIFEGGAQVKDITFAELGDIVYTLVNKST